MMMRSALYQTNTSRGNSQQIDMSLHSDALSRFRANQSLLFLLNAACLAEKQQIPIFQFMVLPDRSWNTRSTALEASTLTPLHTFQVIDQSMISICDMMKLFGAETKHNPWYYTLFSMLKCLEVKPCLILRILHSRQY